MKNVLTHRRYLAALACVMLLVTSTANAKTTHLLLCFPGGPGSTEQAQPIVDEFIGHLAALAGLSDVSGTYINNMRNCKAAMKAEAGASVIMVPLSVYLGERANWKLSAVATLQNKETAGSYHIVAQPGTTLEALKSQVVQSGLKESDGFLSKVAFKGQVDVGSAFTFERTRSARKAVKNVVKGKASAAILNDVQFNALKSSPKYSKLVSILAGPSLPGAIVADVGGSNTSLSAALMRICQEKKDACNKMRITGFTTVDAQQLIGLEKSLKE